MVVRWLALAVFFSVAGAGQPLTFERRRVADLHGQKIAGAALSGKRLIAWGEGVASWSVPEGKSRVLVSGGLFGEGGCVLDVDGDGRLDLVLQELDEPGRLVWLRAPDWTPHVIDSGMETHDLIPATLFGRKGILLVHKYGQVRFYEIPGDAADRWPNREVYSFYTPSRQAGLLLADVDRDRLTDILCGNYWIRSPKRFDLPWRLFAINTYNEAPHSGMARLAMADLLKTGSRQLVVTEGHVDGARLAWFQKPADPRQLWIEHRLSVEPELVKPHGLDAGDLDGDGRTDIVVGENNGLRSRLLVFHNEGRGDFRAYTIGEGTPLHSLRVMDADGDSRLDLAVAGPAAIEWWRNTTQRRR